MDFTEFSYFHICFSTAKETELHKWTIYSATTHKFVVFYVLISIASNHNFLFSFSHGLLEANI